MIFFIEIDRVVLVLNRLYFLYVRIANVYIYDGKDVYSRKKKESLFSLSLSLSLLLASSSPFHFIFKPTRYVALIDIKKTTYSPTRLYSLILINRTNT